MPWWRWIDLLSIILSTIYILKLPITLLETVICKWFIISLLSSNSSEKVVWKSVSVTLPSCKKWILQKSHVWNLMFESSCYQRILSNKYTKVRHCLLKQAVMFCYFLLYYVCEFSVLFPKKYIFKVINSHYCCSNSILLYVLHFHTKKWVILS